MKTSKVAGLTFGLLLIFAFIVFIYLSKLNKPFLEVSHNTLDFGSVETDKEFTITNVAKNRWILLLGLKPLNYDIEFDQKIDWISLYPKSGTTEGEVNTVSVKIDKTKLAIGNNSCKVNIKSNGGDKTIEILAFREKDSIIITEPKPDSTLTVGNKVLVNWESTLGVSNTVDISLYLNECLIKNVVKEYEYRGDSFSPGTFEWEIEEDLIPGGSGYTIRIVDNKNNKLLDEIYPIKIDYPITEIKFENINEAHQKPSTVQYIFSLRDQFNHAVSIDRSELDSGTLQIWENKKEIDYLESHAFLYTQDDFQLQVLLVLDFSASMKKHNDGIGIMIQGSNSLIDSLKETHEISVIEFHRQNKEPSILVPFSNDKEFAKKSIASFASSEIYNDFSVCWDAVHKGLEQFPEDIDPKVFRTLVFLSDGFDNSSYYQPKQLISLANERNVHIYIIGVGNVHAEDVLKDISEKTGGTYIHAESICILLERFEQIINDLGGQYKLSYITPKIPDDGTFNVVSLITHKGVTSYPPLDGQIDASSIYSDTINGIISFNTHHNISNGTVELLLMCEHAPRYIHEFYFNIGTDYKFSVQTVPDKDGGLCENWKVTTEENGWFRLTSPNPSNPNNDIEFGDIGIICKIIVHDVPNEKLVIPFELDNSIYKLGQSFGGNETATDKGSSSIWNTEIVVVPEQH